MKRDFQTVYPENEAAGERPGDAEAHRAAQALADRCDASTIRALTDTIASLERFGGQYHVTSLRAQRDDGTYDTIALAFNYESRDARMKEAAPPDTVRAIDTDIPITPADDPPTEIESPDPSDEGEDQEQPAESGPQAPDPGD